MLIEEVRKPREVDYALLEALVDVFRNGGRMSRGDFIGIIAEKQRLPEKVESDLLERSERRWTEGGLIIIGPTSLTLTSIGETTATQAIELYDKLYDKMWSLGSNPVDGEVFVKAWHCRYPDMYNVARFQGEFSSLYKLNQAAPNLVVKPFHFTIGANVQGYSRIGFSMRRVDFVPSTDPVYNLIFVLPNLSPSERRAISDQIMEFREIQRRSDLIHGDLGSPRNILAERTGDGIRIQIIDPAFHTVEMGGMLVGFATYQPHLDINGETGELAFWSHRSIMKSDWINLQKNADRL